MIVLCLAQILLTAALLPLLFDLEILIALCLVQFLARAGATLGAVIVLGGVLAFLYRHE